MCGIIGKHGAGAPAFVIRGLHAMRMRGQEAAGLYTGSVQITSHPDKLRAKAGTLALGHVLHAMVGCVPQPLAGRGVLVANCEIYNWKELIPSARNDAAALLKLLDEAWPNVLNVLERLDGPYAFAYLREGTLVLARDILGEKPLWYTTRDFAFASDPRVLRNAQELSPRTVLTYTLATRTFSQTRRDFPAPKHGDVQATLAQAVRKRIPSTTYGVLLGGVDSMAILTLAEPARAYTVTFGEEKEARRAQELCAARGWQHTIVAVTQQQVRAALPALLDTIHDTDPVKVAASLTTWFGCEAAARDGCKAIFSGAGADELFAATSRAARGDVSKEMLSGLRKIHERTLHSEDAIAMRFGVELRLPYLDTALVQAVRATPQEARDKKPIRAVLREAKVPFADAKREAAQYSSGAQAMIIKLAREAGYRSLGAYLRAHATHRKRVAVLLSGGKDSILAAHIMVQKGYTLACAITIESKNPDSYLYHTPAVELAALQAQAMGLPHLRVPTEGVPEEELGALRTAIANAQRSFGIDGVVVGAIASEYQRQRVETVSDENGITTYAPLWQVDPERELRDLLRRGFTVIMTAVAAEGLDERWLGQQLDAGMIERLRKLHTSVGLHMAGEGGEYETLVLDAPLFAQRLVLDRSESIKDGRAARLVLEAHLEPKAWRGKSVSGSRQRAPS